MCPMVPAWGVLAFAASLGLMAADVPLWGLALAHGAIALLTWRAWRFFGRTSLASRRAAWISLALPVVGPLAAALITSRTAAVPSGPLEPAGTAWIGPDDLAPIAPRFRGVAELEPALHTGALETRLSAVRALKALDGPEGVRVLRDALSVADHQAPLLASLALAELETDFENATRDARLALAGAEEAQRPAALLALAATLRRYAESGLPTGPSVPALWQEVERLAAEAQAGDPGVTALGHLAAARLALSEPAGALAAADLALARAPDDPASAVLRLEALYGLRDLDRLRDEAARLITIAVPGTVAHDIATYWSTAHVPQACPRTL